MNSRSVFGIAYSETNQETKNEKADTAYISWLIHEGEKIYLEQLPKAMEKWESALMASTAALKGKHNPAITKKLKELKALALNNVGYGYNEKGEFKKALQIHLECLKIRKELKQDIELAEPYNNIAYAYNQLGDFRNAIHYNLKSLKIRERNKDTLGCAISLNNIGHLYSLLKDSKSAVKFYNRSLKNYELVHDQYGIVTSLNNISLLVMGNKKIINPEAKSMLDKALKIAKRINSATHISLTLHNIGIYFERKYQFEEALVYFQRSYEIEDSLGNDNGRAVELQTIGSVYSMLKQPDKALRYLKEADKIAQREKYPHILKNAHLNLHALYASKKDYSNAYRSLALYHRLNDSLYNSDLHREATQKELAYEYGKKTLEDSLKQKHAEEKRAVEQAAFEARANRDTLLKWFLVAGICFVLIIVFIIWNRLKIIRDQKKTIEASKHEVDEKNREITDSINYARRLQEAILPPEKFWKENLPDSFVFYQPKDIVAGDFYWMETVEFEIRNLGFEIENSHSILNIEPINKKLPEKGNIISNLKPKISNLILFAAADCTGHGVPGAMVSVVCCNALNRAVKEFKLTEPGLILDKTRQLVLETFARSEGEVKDGMDISLCALNPITMELKWAGAHNPLWIISHEESNEEVFADEVEMVSSVSHKKSMQNQYQEALKLNLSEIKPDKQHIGKTDHPKPFQTHTIRLKKNDLIILLTDGYIDQFGGDVSSGSGGKKYKTKRLKEILLKNAWLPIYQQKTILTSELESWKGDMEQTDDICIIGVRI